MLCSRSKKMQLIWLITQKKGHLQLYHLLLIPRNTLLHFFTSRKRCFVLCLKLYLSKAAFVATCCLFISPLLFHALSHTPSRASIPGSCLEVHQEHLRRGTADRGSGGTHQLHRLRFSSATAVPHLAWRTGSLGQTRPANGAWHN